jgi:pimeloyl-ACP methyl ester carboxylesterase
MKIKANGIYINYEVKGEGKNLFLIHTVGDNLNIWYNQVPVLSKSYRVITYDMRGFGKTDSPNGEYTIALMAEDAYNLLKAIDVEETYVLGHSLGGRIALELAIKNPEMVKALIFANSSPALTPPTDGSPSLLQETVEQIRKGDIKTIAEMSASMFVSQRFQSHNPEEFDKYVKIKLQNKADGFDRITRATLLTPQVPPDLSKIKCPLLLIRGEYDRTEFKIGAKNIHQAVTNSKLVTLPTGHTAAVELPDKFNSAVLAFLSEINDN